MLHELPLKFLWQLDCGFWNLEPGQLSHGWGAEEKLILFGILHLTLVELREAKGYVQHTFMLRAEYEEAIWKCSPCSPG